MIKTYLLVGMLCIPTIECFNFMEPTPKQYMKLENCLADGKKLGDLGVEYGENFQFREILSDDYGQQLKNTEGLIKVQRDAIDVLGREYQQILNLQDDFLIKNLVLLLHI